MQNMRCIAIALFAVTTMSCSTDEVNPTEPISSERGGLAGSNTIDPTAIVVSNTAELEAALTPANAGRLIQIRAGLYNLTELLHVRNDFTRLRTIVRPQRDVIERLARGDSKLVRGKLLPYFRDLRDNLVRLEDTAAGYHERLLMAFDIYLNKAAFEANEGIKFLTAITAVTIPVMIIGTWYGMNFEDIPELARGYPFAVGVTFVSTLLMFWYLKKKKWF